MKNLDTVLRVITYLTSFWLTFYTRMFAYIKLLAKPNGQVVAYIRFTITTQKHAWS